MSRPNWAKGKALNRLQPDALVDLLQRKLDPGRIEAERLVSAQGRKQPNLIALPLEVIDRTFLRRGEHVMPKRGNRAGVDELFAAVSALRRRGEHLEDGEWIGRRIFLIVLELGLGAAHHHIGVGEGLCLLGLNPHVHRECFARAVSEAAVEAGEDVSGQSIVPPGRLCHHHDLAVEELGTPVDAGTLLPQVLLGADSKDGGLGQDSILSSPVLLPKLGGHRSGEGGEVPRRPHRLAGAKRQG